MKIPNTVRIAGVDYTVRFEEKLISDEGKAVAGIINHSEALIVILDKQQDYQYQCKTFLHEVMHAIDLNFKLDLDEDVIDSIANGFYMVIMDNPEMFEDKPCEK